MAAVNERMTSPPKMNSASSASIVVTRGQRRSRQRLVDGVVQQLRQRHLLVSSQILADAVVDDDRIVQRIADDGQDGGDRGLVELDAR